MSLTNTQYETIMREYYDIQSHNKKIAASRRKEISEISPEYDRLAEEIGELSLQTAFSRLSGAGEDSASGPGDSEYRTKLDELRKKQADILTSVGKPVSYLEPIYSCERCKDTGYIGTVKCGCFKKREIELLYKDSNLKNMAGDHSFEDFRLDLYSEEEVDAKTGKTARELASSALDAAKDFVKDFDKNRGNLFFYGSTGLGKTFLSTCIATALINTVHSVVYVTATELFNRLDTFDEEVGSSPLLECDLLIIDDLGTEYHSELSASRLFYCINDRMLRGKSCVISTNLDLKTLRDHYSERLFSRIISSYRIIKLYGRDIRTAQLFG